MPLSLYKVYIVNIYFHRSNQRHETTFSMEFFQVFSFLIVLYAFITLLPRKGRITASISILISILGISFFHQSGMVNDIINSFITIYNSSTFSAQMLVCFSIAFSLSMSLSSPALKSQEPMEFSQFLDFIKILCQSLKIVPKNGKLMGLVITLSLLVPSILFSLFTFVYQFLLNRFPNNSIPITLLCILGAEIAFLLACSLIFQFSAIAIILVSAAAYSDHSKLSSSDLYSRIKTNWRRQLINNFSRSTSPPIFELVNGAITSAIFVAAIVNITSAVLLIFFMDPAYAVWPLSAVVSVMEDSSDGREAQERASSLVEGKRVHGFMVKLLYIVTLVFSLILADDRYQIHLTRGLLLLNLVVLGRILWWILHVVLYFGCKKEKGEEISDALGIGKAS